MLALRVVNNGDHAGLIWFPSDGQPVQNCLGFAVQRTLTRAGATQTAWLHNYIGFSQGDPPPPAGQEWRWPIQRFLWWDYAVQPDDVVAYQVVPVVGADKASLSLDMAGASAISPSETITGQDGRCIEAYFNRGVIATQWVARALNAQGGKPRTSLLDDVAEVGNPLRVALSGWLRPRLLDLLANAPGKVYAALYELDDPEVVPALKKLGQNCFLILANGAFKPPANDENAKVRADLGQTSQINLSNRMVSSGHFAHNKFMVFCDAAGEPAMVWTGSTNCTTTGLCTQSNNGILIKDPAVAGAFLQEWNRLKAAGNAYPPELAAANSARQDFQVPPDGPDSNKVTTWFAPTAHGEDMVDARTLINQAKDGILFLNFNPGIFEQDPAQWTLLQTIVNRHNPDAQAPIYDPNLYIRGVVNQEITNLTTDPATTSAQPAVDPTAAATPVALFDGGSRAPQRLGDDVLVPAAIQKQYSLWQTELKGASSVMIHSKVIVLDPFGDNPVVMTGSHNQGMKASHSNDDNLVIIQGNADLAQAYALNAIAIFQEYRWRHYVANRAGSPGSWSGLEENPSWQQGYLDQRQELDFWTKGGVQPAAGGAKPAAAVAEPV